MSISNVSTEERMAIVDAETQQSFAGKLKSQNLVLMSNNFEEYTHNFPNPFRAGSQETQIAYFLDSAANVSVKIYSLSGELVYKREYAAGSAEGSAGAQEVPWDGRNMQGEVVRNGVYVCRVEAGSNTATFRIAVAK
jgi:flagellar hook assembly protein FlgD